MKRKRLTLIVCDAGPIIHLHELGALAALSDAKEVWVPEAVWKEVVAHAPAALEDRSVTWRRKSVDGPLPGGLIVLARALELGAGETEALALLAERPDAILASDDTAARTAAAALHYEAHGTLGFLLRAGRVGTMKPAEVFAALKEAPRRSTLHVKPSLLEEIIARAETVLRPRGE